MKLGIASDHRGYKLKNKIINYLHDTGYSYVDFGTNNEDSTDYVDYAVQLGQKAIAFTEHG